jgi:hypothetical protein
MTEMTNDEIPMTEMTKSKARRESCRQDHD